MADRWLGVVVAGDRVTLVDESAARRANHDRRSNILKLQNEDRPEAYCAIAKQVRDYAKEANIQKCVIKASAVSRGGTTLSHLESAELRGVISCALREVAPVEATTKAKISKTFGERKADEYLGDDEFWNGAVQGSLRGGSREAALVILAVRAK